MNESAIFAAITVLWYVFAALGVTCLSVGLYMYFDEWRRKRDGK